MSAAAARLFEQCEAPRSAPRSAAPTAARGALLFDPSGRALVDFHNAAGAVVLGHACPQVEAAAAEPGSSSALRQDLAERLFARHARAETLRLEREPAAAYAYALDCAERVTGRRGAVDAAVVAADPAAAREVAAVVIDPFADAVGPAVARAARLAADKADCVLIMDERRSAFRCHRGGGEGLLGVAADLTVYGRTLANGRPLSAVCGPRALLDPAQAMPEACTDAALAAGVATLRLISADPVTTALRCRGSEVEAELENQIADCGLSGAAQVVGDATWSRILFSDDADGALQRHWRRTLYAHGIYTQGEQVMSFAHGDREVTQFLDATALAFSAIARLRDAARA